MELIGVEPIVVHVAALPIAYSPIVPSFTHTGFRVWCSLLTCAKTPYQCVVLHISNPSLPTQDNLAASDNRLPACFQFKVSEHPYTVSSIRPGGQSWTRTNGVSCVPDLQSGAFAARLSTHIKNISLSSTKVLTLGKLIPLSIFYYRLVALALDCIDNTALFYNKEIMVGTPALESGSWDFQSRTLPFKLSSHM